MVGVLSGVDGVLCGGGGCPAWVETEEASCQSPEVCEGVVTGEAEVACDHAPGEGEEGGCPGGHWGLPGGDGQAGGSPVC